MRFAIAILFLVSVCNADSFLFVQDGKALSSPRDLPSVGVRLDTKQTVLGLHGADDATKAACGWYRVVPAEVVLAKDQIINGRSYTIGKDAAFEIVSVTNVVRRTLTAQRRMEMIFDGMPGTDAERVKAVVQAVAAVVTNRVKGDVTVTIPAEKAEAVK